MLKLNADYISLKLKFYTVYRVLISSFLEI